MRKSVLALVLAIILLLTACSSAATHTLTYVNSKVASLTRNDEEVRIACVYTEYTNHSSKRAFPADWVNVKAYQGGVELPIVVYSGERIDGYDQCDDPVEPGATAKVIWTFPLKTNAPVTVEFSDGQTFTIGGK